MFFLCPWGPSYYFLSLPCVMWHRNPRYIFSYHALCLMFLQYIVNCWLRFQLYIFRLLFFFLPLLAIIFYVMIYFSIIKFCWLSSFLLLFTFSSPNIFQQSFLWCPGLSDYWQFCKFETFYYRILFHCACIYRKLCRYLCIGILHKGIFHILLRFLFLIVCSFVQISPNFCHGSYK